MSSSSLLSTTSSQSSHTTSHPNLAFPTLRQVQRQSLSHSIKRASSTGTTRSSLHERQQRREQEEQQRATLERVVRLSARMLGLPVAIITTSTATSSCASNIVAHHGLHEVPWIEEAMAHLPTSITVEPLGSSHHSSRRVYCEHVPLQVQAHQAPLGTLSLMGVDARPSLSPLEQESLQDLAFLATQALHQQHQQHQRNKPLPEEGIQQLNSPSTAISSMFLGRQISQVSVNSTDATTIRAAANSFSSSRKQQLQDDGDHHHHHHHDQDGYNDYSENDKDISEDPSLEDPSKCIIACTAHDLLTPLMGLQLSLSLLQDDATFLRYLEEQPLQRESFWTAWQSTEVMFRMCQTTIDTLRAEKQARLEQHQQHHDLKQQQRFQNQQQPLRVQDHPRLEPTTQVCHVDLAILMQSLQRLMDPIPKQVPLILSLSRTVPPLVPIVTTVPQPQQPSSLSYQTNTVNSTSTHSVDWNILRCTLTVISNACRLSHDEQRVGQERQPIHFRISLVNNNNGSHDESSSSSLSHHSQQRLVLACDYDCPDLDVTGDSTLALQSVALQMQTVLGGQHGFVRHQDSSSSSSSSSRATFWFSVPVGDTSASRYNRQDRVVTLRPTTPLPVATDNYHAFVVNNNQTQESSPPSTPSSGPASPTTTKTTTTVAEAVMMTRRSGTVSPRTRPQGLRRLRRSSTGSTKTMSSRRRSFDDMTSITETFGNNNKNSNKKGMVASSSCVRLGTTTPSLLPTTMLPRAQSHFLRLPQKATGSKRGRNFQYPKQSQTTASSAMAAAFQATLASASPTLWAAALNDMEDDASSMNNAMANTTMMSRLSYSLLQEEEQQHQLHREKLERSQLRSGGTKQADRSNQSSGLDRCLQDLLGSSDNSSQRVRNRLSLGKATDSTSTPTLSGRERKALVIEDSLVIRKTVGRALSKKMDIHTVVQACDGVEGVQRLKEQVFDIVLCDFSMPNLGGIECVQQYRQWEEENQPQLDRPKQYIVGMSAHASPSDIAQGLKVGMNQYVPKPITIQCLTELMESPPMHEARKRLDAWQNQSSHGSSSNGFRAIGDKPESLFADFTSSTANMLDAMNATSPT
jgi:CheY-like chemotaxis protein